MTTKRTVSFEFDLDGLFFLQGCVPHSDGFQKEITEGIEELTRYQEAAAEEAERLMGLRDA